MTISSVLREIQSSIPDCLAAGVIDVPRRVLLAYSIEIHQQEALALVARPTSELFRREQAGAIERMFKPVPGLENDDAFEEIALYSDNLLHVFQRCRQASSAMLVTVCRKTANLPMVMLESRRRLDDVCRSITALEPVAPPP
jgi:hypothetical protein